MASNMDRNIPHMMDIFTSSPGERRRAVKEREAEKNVRKQKENDKNAGSDSAVSLGSSEEEDENEKNISIYFEYLNEVEENLSAKRKKAKNSLNKNIKSDFRRNDDRLATGNEKDIKHIDKHLSMKKTIRKKMMRDLQQAFVENPGDLREDPNKLTHEKRSIIDLHNLTISKRKMSKSEHSFLDMLKDDDKQRKCVGGSNAKTAKTGWKNSQDEDSGLDSPPRSAFRSQSKQDVVEAKETPKPIKEDKKPSLWKRLTGKNKTKR